jgi:hypothetical protein
MQCTLLTFQGNEELCNAMEKCRSCSTIVALHGTRRWCKPSPPSQLPELPQSSTFCTESSVDGHAALLLMFHLSASADVVAMAQHAPLRKQPNVTFTNLLCWHASPDIRLRSEKSAVHHTFPTSRVTAQALARKDTGSDIGLIFLTRSIWFGAALHVSKEPSSAP